MINSSLIFKITRISTMYQLQLIVFFFFPFPNFIRVIRNTISFAFDEALVNRFPLSATFTCMCIEVSLFLELSYLAIINANLNASRRSVNIVRRFRPSTTSEPFRTDFDRVYHAAEIMGRQGVSLCDSLFPECTVSPLDYFTEVHQRSFGIRSLN